MKVFLKQNIAIIIILLIGIILRLYKLDFQSAWLDELHTLVATNLNLSFKEMHSLLIAREGFPHFYFLLVKFFSFLFGHEIVVVRVISMVFGLLSILYIYKLGYIIHSKNVGVASAIVLCLHSFAIDHSQDGRVYSILMFFVIISFYYLVRFLNNTNTRNAVGLGLCAGMIINSQPIGLLHVASLFLVIFIYLFLNQTKDGKKSLLKYGVISGLITLVFFGLASSMILKVSNITSHWIPKLSLSHFYSIMHDLLGKSIIMFWLFTFVFFIFNIIFIIKFFKRSISKKERLTFILLNVWLVVFLGVISFKSYFGVSLFLQRYLIGVLPAFIIMLSIIVFYLNSKKISYGIIIIISFYMLHLHIYQHDYYNKLTKSQYDLVANEIFKLQTGSKNVVSKWAFVMSYYFNKSNGFNCLETDLNSYLDNMRTGNVPMISFWYMDGNSNQFQLTPENEKYLYETFRIKYRVNRFDAWALYLELKNNTVISLDLRKFNYSLFNEIGQLFIVNNQKYTYPKFNLENGKYQLTINIQSLPNPPLNNVNANFNLFINKQRLANFDASEKDELLSNIFEVEITNNELLFQIEFTNDEVINGVDRNAILKNIKIEKL